MGGGFPEHQTQNMSQSVQLILICDNLPNTERQIQIHWEATKPRNFLVQHGLFCTIQCLVQNNVTHYITLNVIMNISKFQLICFVCLHFHIWKKQNKKELKPSLFHTPWGLVGAIGHFSDLSLFWGVWLFQNFVWPKK